jgi:hypothetical protein
MSYIELKKDDRIMKLPETEVDAIRRLLYLGWIKVEKE